MCSFHFVHYLRILHTATSPTTITIAFPRSLIMESKRTSRASRGMTRGKRVTIASSPPAKSVSASAVFKRPTNAQRVRKRDERAQSPKISSSPSKKSRSASRKKQAPHPLAEAFEDATSEYRDTLLSMGIAALDKYHASLVAALHEVNLEQLSSPTAQDPNASPIRLTLAAKYERSQHKLLNRVGEYHIRRRITNETGETEAVDVSIEEMLAGFQDRYLAEVERLSALQTKWETVVGEIWKTGVNYFGEDVMQELFVDGDLSNASSPAPDDQMPGNHLDDADSLFVPERSPQAKTASKKRVTFQEPPIELPEFLTSASRFKGLPRPTELPHTEIKALEQVVGELGKEHVAEMKGIDKEYQRFWEKKLGNMRRVVVDDE
ncbi:unnamed protein product [Periconia digitata]|uniref:Uncharacterized protein n=1 Tax=Periconia digitata TaxID=1303443 RepID=A0A9W4UMT2_9PLEO|nr:unnamed protein product [Periconia digitata]